MKKIILILMISIFGLNGEEVYATFSVEAAKSANLAFTSGGIVSEVTVEVATAVQKGQVLARLHSDDLKALFGINETALKYAKLDYDRQKKVKNLIDKAKFDQYAFKYENAKAQLKYQQSLLDKTILLAPFDGVIYEKSVEVGDAVSGAMIRTVLKIQSQHKRKLILEFDQKYWKSIKIGQVFNYSIDGDSKKYSGIISKIYPLADSGNRKIRAEVETKDFMVGLFGSGTIITVDKK